MPVRIITDSTSDIEPHEAAELGLGVVPLYVIWGAKSYRDYVDLSRAEFYERFASEPALPTTSQPTPQMFAQAFAPHLNAGYALVCIVLSAKLSGTINAARTAAEQFPGAPITVFDSQSVAGGLRMQVLQAHRLAAQGAQVPEILAALEQARQAQRLYACIPDLSHAVRTGRIGKARAAIGTLMKIVPVISLREGEVVADAQVRTMARAQQTMIDLSLAAITDPQNARFLVMHTNAAQQAAEILDRLRSRLRGEQPKVLEIIEAGPVIAVHGGAGAVGVFSAQDHP